MDRHELPGLTAVDAANAHLRDMEVQDKFLTYWFDYERQTAFCLATPRIANHSKRCITA